MRYLDIEIKKPDDCTVVHNLAVRIQVGTWKLQILKQRRRSD